MDRPRRDALRTADDVIMSMQINWHRFAARFLRMDLSYQLADAVMKDDPPEKLRNLARLVIAHRTHEQRDPAGGAS